MKFRLAVILLLALGFLGAFPAAASAENYVAYTNVTGSCDGQNITFSGTFSYKIVAGSTFKGSYSVTHQGQTQTSSFEGTFPQDLSGNSPIGGTIPADYILEETYELYNPDGSLASKATLHIECGSVWGSGDKGIPGCDLLPIPETAVVGSFTSNAEVYWAPGQLVEPATTITEGNTAWVLGMDASGQYYEIIWSCDYLWVPVGSMGPNFDDVWQGRPLPTEVVK